MPIPAVHINFIFRLYCIRNTSNTDRKLILRKRKMVFYGQPKVTLHPEWCIEANALQADIGRDAFFEQSFVKMSRTAKVRTDVNVVVNFRVF